MFVQTSKMHSGLFSNTAPMNGIDDSNDPLAMAKLVIEITRRFALSLNLSDVLSDVLTLTVNTLGTDTGSIFLLDRQQQVSRHILARRNLPAEQSAQVVSAVFEKGLAGWVVRHRTVALVEDTLNDPRWYHLPDDELKTRSAIAVPLLHRGELNGLLTLTSGKPRAFSRADLDLIALIAGQAATAVENARLFTRVRNEHAVLRALISGVQQPIIVTDAANRIRYTNPAAATLDHRLDEGAVGQPVAEVLTSQALATLFRRLNSSGQTQRDEIPWDDGRTFYANLVMVPGVGAVAVLHDVTSFKELDRMKSEFVAMVSHDLKAPLTVIQGYTDLLQGVLPDLDAFADQSLREITASVKRMKDLISALLDLAQIEAGLDQSNQRCQMHEIIADVVDSFRLQASQKEIALNVEVPPELPAILGHPIRLGQAVANLLGNALKYTPNGGKVSVLANCNGNRLVVKVADTGPGIPLAKQAGLFSKFYRVGAKETHAEEGHGLGLAIVKSVVESHRGRVWVESQIGQGSIFAFSIPLKREGT
jgi:signal transduction histidine kinase